MLTPNKNEVELLLNRQITSSSDVVFAAKDLLEMGVQSVLIKGGHFTSSGSHDYWSNGGESFWLMHERSNNRNIHGTGCVLSSAVAACMALGYDFKDSLVIARMYANRGIRYAKSSKYPVLFQHSMGWPEEEMDLPVLNLHPHQKNPAFCVDDLLHMGLYPIVDSVKWLRLLLPLGIKCIQLRIKDKTGNELLKEIKEGISLAKHYQVKLFINDYWELALKLGAYGVHLGQEDIYTADVNAIHAAGLRLGISTHCYAEVACAHFYRPSYMACGPIFYTTSKVMPFAPQGLLALTRWRKILNYPLVAIGGINIENINSIVGTNINGVAVISAITHANNPVKALKDLMNKVNNHVSH